MRLLRGGVEGWLRRSWIWPLLNSSWLSVDGLSNLCQVDGQINVGKTQMTKFSSNRPVKSTLTTDQSLVKRALSIMQLIQAQFWHVDQFCGLVHIGYQSTCDSQSSKSLWLHWKERWLCCFARPVTAWDIQSMYHTSYSNDTVKVALISPNYVHSHRHYRQQTLPNVWHVIMIDTNTATPTIRNKVHDL